MEEPRASERRSEGGRELQHSSRREELTGGGGRGGGEGREGGGGRRKTLTPAAEVPSMQFGGLAVERQAGRALRRGVRSQSCEGPRCNNSAAGSER